MYFCWIFDDVKGYRLLQLNSIEIIIKIDVKFDEDIMICDPNSTFVPSSSYSLNNTLPMATYLDDDSDDENTPPPTLVPLAAPQLP